MNKKKNHFQSSYNRTFYNMLSMEYFSCNNKFQQKEAKFHFRFVFSANHSDVWAWFCSERIININCCLKRKLELFATYFRHSIMNPGRTMITEGVPLFTPHLEMRSRWPR